MTRCPAFLKSMSVTLIPFAHHITHPVITVTPTVPQILLIVTDKSSIWRVHDTEPNFTQMTVSCGPEHNVDQEWLQCHGHETRLINKHISATCRKQNIRGVVIFQFSHGHIYVGEVWHLCDDAVPMKRLHIQVCVHTATPSSHPFCIRSSQRPAD